MDLTPNYTLEEMIFSQTANRLGIFNSAPDEAVAYLQALCQTLLEPAQAQVGMLHIDSGYRCPALNMAVGGAKTSAHLEGRAADCIPKEMELRKAFDALRQSALPYDQIILECNAWIHLAIARDGATSRREALTAAGGPGHWSYEVVR